MNRVVTGLSGIALLLAGVLAAGDVVAAHAAGCDYVLVVDCSGTMRDGGRGTATVEAIRSLVTGMDPDDRVSVYGYGERAHALLSEYPMVVGEGASRQAAVGAIRFTFDDDRTDMTAGLELVWSERDRVLPTPGARLAGRRGCVILLTDGKLVPVYEDYSQYQTIYEASRRRLLELAGLFGTAGIPVHAIALGKADAVDGELLAQVSQASGGEYRHSPTSAALGGAFEAIAERVLAAEPESADQVAASDAAADAGEAHGGDPETAAGRDGSTGPADEQLPNAFQRALAAAGRRSAYPAAAYQVSTAALGVLMGVVAIGMRRRQSWTGVFTRQLGHEPLRVKGYLKPLAPEGVTLARACVPLENPGLECVTLGTGGEFLNELTDTALEIIGTPGGTPPFVRMLKGTITVDGEIVTERRKLVDGNVLDIESRRYVYLRGSRR